MESGLTTTRATVVILLEGGELAGAPGTEGWSGFIRYWAPAMQALSARGIEVIFGTLRGRSPLHQVVEDYGVTTFCLDARSARDYPRAAFTFRRLLRGRRVDVLHASDAIQAAVGGTAALGHSDLARIFHRHHEFIPGPHRHFTAVASRLAHLTIAVSDAVARAATIGNHVPSSKVCVAYNGIDGMDEVPPDAITAWRERLGLAGESKVVLLVGHLRREKGHDTALKAFRRLGDRSIHLVVAGTGPEATTLKNAAASMANVHFIGHQRDLSPLYRMADAVIVPSYSEPFGLVAIEAMSASKPVIASRVGGLSEIVTDGVDGILVEPRDDTQLADKILETVRSPERAAELGSNALATFTDRFTMEAMVFRWVRCYEKALDRRLIDGD